MMYVESRMARLLVQYFEYLKLVDKSEVLVSHPNEGIWPSLALAMARNPEIDWSKGRLTALQAPNGPQRAKIPEADHTSLPERGEVTKMVSLPPGIQLLGAAAFDHLWPSEEVVEAFVIWLGECQGLLGAQLEGITGSERNRRMLNARAGAAALVAADEWHSDGSWMTATGSARHGGRNWSTGLGPIVTNRLIRLSRDPYPSPLCQRTLQCRQG